MSGPAADIEAFLDTVSDEKLKDWQAKQYTIVRNFKIGFRLDHQGVSLSGDPFTLLVLRSLKMNQDGTGTHRLFIQPLKGGRSRWSKVPPGTVLAQVHVADPAEPKNVRQAFIDSAAHESKIVVAKPKV